MSDKDDKNIEQVVEEAETADGALDNGDTTVEAPEPHVPVTPPAPAAPPARKSFSAVAWLALLLVLALAGAAAWYLQDLLQREAALLDRLAGRDGVEDIQRLRLHPAQRLARLLEPQFDILSEIRLMVIKGMEMFLCLFFLVC